MLYISLYYLGNLCKIFMTRNGFEDFENIVDIWLLKYLMKLQGSKLCIWKHLTCELLMWVCPCDNVLATTSLWCVITLSLRCVIIPSSWRKVRLEAPTLHDTGKSLSVWMRLLPIWPKDHMQKGYCVTHHSLLPTGGRGKSLSVWVRPSRAKRLHTKEVLHDVLSPAAHGGDR